MWCFLQAGLLCRRSAAPNLCKPARPGPCCALRRLVGAGAWTGRRSLGVRSACSSSTSRRSTGPPRRRRPSARRSTSRRRARGSCGSRAASPDAGTPRPDDPRLRQAFVERPFVRDDPLLRAVRLEQGHTRALVRLRGLVRACAPARSSSADRARARHERTTADRRRARQDAGRAWARESEPARRRTFAPSPDSPSTSRGGRRSTSSPRGIGAFARDARVPSSGFRTRGPSHELLYNFGSLDGGGIWSVEQAYYASARGNTRVVPQIYSHAMAHQWADLARSGLRTYHRPLRFAGVLTQHRTRCACSLEPHDARRALQRALALHVGSLGRPRPCRRC